MNCNDTHQGDRLPLSLSLKFTLSLDFLSLFIYLSIQPFFWCVDVCVQLVIMCVCVCVCVCVCTVLRYSYNVKKSRAPLASFVEVVRSMKTISVF